jgi:predicted nucleotidyltransferase
MGDGVYSAGTIFLQVVPVFKDVQEKISRNARDWDKALGDELEKSGKSAGERANKALGEELGKDLDKHGERAGKAYAGHFETSIKAAVKNAQRELDAIDFAQVKKKLHSLDDGTQFESVRRGARTASDDAIRDFERVQATLTNLSRQDFSVDFDEKKLLRDVQRSMAAVDRLLKGDHELAVTTNLLQVMAQLEKAEKRFDEAAARKREIRFGVTADLKQVDREMGSFEKKFRATAQRAAEGFGDSMNHKIRQVKGELETLSQTDINIDADAATALAQLAEVKAYLETMLQDQTISIDVRSDIKGAVAELAAYQKAIAAIDPEVERVSGAFERKMRAAAKAGAQAIGDDTNDALRSIKARLATLGDVRIGVDMDAEEARTEIRKLETQLRYLAKESPDIDVNVAASAAMAELYAFRVMLNKLDGREVDIKVKTNAATAAASMGLLNRATALFTPNAEAAGGAGQSAANSFRSFNFMILGAVVLLPALIPMIAALAGGLLALLPILGALVGGLGVAVIGFSGIGDAVKAMGDAEKNAAKDSEVASQKMRDAAYAVADAQRNLADARRSAGEASADAARAVADAERQAGR